MSVAERVGVAGAGTMGAGIAQLAALGGYETFLHDPDAAALERGLERLRGDLAKGVARGRWSEAAAAEATTRLHGVGELEDLGGCDLVVEAAPEDVELKRSLFARLEGALRSRRGARNQHLVAVGDGDCRRGAAAPADLRHALLQSRRR